MMSYSRWGDSTWYTFWRTQDETTKNRDTAIFEICGEHSFTAKELREHLEGCLAMISGATQDELEELKEYITEFLYDIDEKYPEVIE